MCRARALLAVTAVIAGLPAGCGDGFGANPAPPTTSCDTAYAQMYCSAPFCGNGFRNACGERPGTGYNGCVYDSYLNH